MAGNLTNLICEQAVAAVSDQRGGLTLFPDKGIKRWYWRTTLAGKPITVSLGTYPDIGLEQARKLFTEAKALRDAGEDPRIKKWSALGQGRKLSTDMKAWFERENLSGRWGGSPDVWRSLERDILPDLGERLTRSITAEMLNNTLDKVVQRGAIETAHRLAQRLAWFFDYAEASGMIESDPSLKIKRRLPKVPKATAMAAILDLKEARKMLRDVETTVGFPVVTLAHRFHVLTASRPGMVETAEWNQFLNLWGDEPVWRIPGDRMKGRLDFDQPLSSHAVDVLREMHKISGTLKYVFRGEQNQNRPLSNSAMNSRLKDVGYENRHVPHGWRSTFSTIMHDRHPDMGVQIEMCLAHLEAKGKIRRIYDRGAYISQRRALLTEWANLILADAIPLEQILAMPKRRIGDWQSRLNAASSGVLASVG